MNHKSLPLVLSITLALSAVSYSQIGPDFGPTLTPGKSSSSVTADSTTAIPASKGASASAIPPQRRDHEPPTVFIDAPAVASPGMTMNIVATDNLGLFKVGYGLSSSIHQELLFSAEKNVTHEVGLGYFLHFGKDLIINAYATDLAGNSATAKQSVTSQEIIEPGRYVIDPPIDEQISGQGCGLQHHPLVYSPTHIGVGGSYDIQDCWEEYPEIESPYACLMVGTSRDGDYLENHINASASIRMASPTDTYFSSDEDRAGQASWLENFTSGLEIEYFDTSPPTVQASISFRCDDPTYGIEEWGPYLLYGQLEQ